MSNTTTTPIQRGKRDIEAWHWCLIAINVLICVVGVIGNGLVIYVVTQKPKKGPFRHLNKVVRNLGITDFLFGLVAAPLIFIYWTWCWNGEMQRMKDEKEVLKLNGILFLPNVLTSSSCFFVALIVFLRLMTVKRSAGYEIMHEKLSRFGSIIIWIFSFLVWLFPLIMSTPSLYQEKLYLMATFIAFQVTHTVPMLLTAIVYFKLLCILKQADEISNRASIQKKSLARMIRGVVVGLLICNGPYVAWVGYIAAMAQRERFSEVFDTHFGIAFQAVARFMMLINSCINPLVYTTTIPDFKDLVKELLNCNLTRKLVDMALDTSETSEMNIRKLRMTMRNTLKRQTTTLQSGATSETEAIRTMRRTLSKQTTLQ